MSIGSPLALRQPFWLLLISAAVTLGGCSSSQSPATPGAGSGGGGGVSGVGNTSSAAGAAQSGAFSAGGVFGVGGSSSGGAGGHGGVAGASAAAGAFASGGNAGTASAGSGGAGSGGTASGGVSGASGSSGAAGAAGAPYLPCPTTAGTACAVLPLGDSITEGCCTAPMGGYRVELFRQAVTNGKNITFVGTATNGPSTVQNRTFPMHHEGHGGYTIAGGGNGAIAGAITDTAISSYHPNIVLLMIGTNDINGNIDVAKAPTRLGQLMDEITTDAPAALLVVATIIPIGAPNADQRVQAYNATIPGLVSARASAGKHVVFLDTYTPFANDSNYQSTRKADGLHPNSAGYVVLGQAFYDAIAALLPAAP
ncbi:MAG: SGNH/GDSL hydrolase family protein [Polyangiaceae bacterium]